MEQGSWKVIILSAEEMKKLEQILPENEILRTQNSS